MGYKQYYASPLGTMTLTSDGQRLTGLCFAGQKYYDDVLCGNETEMELPVFAQTVKWLDIYFSGKKPDFTPPISIQTSAFRKQVWELLLEIPYGQTVTYGALADKIAEKSGGAPPSAQAVGGAVGHNAIALIIPCHRVVGKGGSLTGYAGGIERKAALLRLEAVDTSAFFMPKQGTAL